MHKEIRLTGSGGQGVILMGIILAEAAVEKGLQAIQSQSYGPEARGGASKCEVILSDQPIDFPKVLEPNILVALTQDGANKYAHGLGEDCLAIFDESVEVPENLGTKNVFSYQIIETARYTMGKSIFSTIVTLGVFCELTDIYTREELLHAILQRVPKGSEVLNERAFDEGIKFVRRA